MESLCRLWQDAAVASSSASLLHQFHLDNIIPYSPHSTLSHTMEHKFTGASHFPSINNDTLFHPAPVSSFMHATDDGASFNTLADSDGEENELHSPSPCGHERILSILTSKPSAVVRSPFDISRRLATNASGQFSIANAELPDVSLQLVAAHYLCDAHRRLELDYNTVESDSPWGNNTDYSELLQQISAVCQRLFPLLPIGRLSDYLVPSESTSSNLEEAAKVAAQLLSLVEDLYLACAGEKRGAVGRGSGVSLARLRELSSVFSELSEEDRCHVSFLEACLANPSNALAATGSYIALEDALRALLRIRPIESMMQDGVLRTSTKKSMLDQEEECDLLRKIAVQLVAPVRSTKAAIDPTFSPLTSDVLPLFELLTAPFIMLSSVGTPDVVLEAFNSSAGSLLKGHTGGDLSGFRYFATNETKLAFDSEVRSYRVAQWFKELASGLKNSMVVTQDGNLCTGGVDWLCGPGGLHEVSLRPGFGKETLLTVLERGTEVRPGGVPIVIEDVSSGTFYGVQVFSWGVGVNRNDKCSSLHRVALFFRFLLSGSTTAHQSSCSVAAISALSSPPLGVATFPIRKHHSAALTSTPLESLWEQTSKQSSQSLPSHPPRYVVPHRPAETSQPIPLNVVAPYPSQDTSLGNFACVALRGNYVDVIKLAALTQRLSRRSRVSEVIIGENTPSDFIVNDNLLLHVVQEVLDFNEANGVSLSTVVLHRCGMHLVVDLLPHHMWPQVEAETDKLMADMDDFYQKPFTNVKVTHLRSNESELLSECHAAEIQSEWIDKVIACSHLIQLHNQSPLQQPDLLSLTRQSSLVVESYELPAPASAAVLHIPQCPPLVVKLELPDVWAVKVGKERGDQSIVAPTLYLPAAICDLLVSVKAAVVVMPSGAATIVFPYITEDRLALLKEMDKVSQPLSAAADLGIVELNRMAQEAAQECRREHDTHEAAEPCEVVPLGFGEPILSTAELDLRESEIHHIQLLDKDFVTHELGNFLSLSLTDHKAVNGIDVEKMKTSLSTEFLVSTHFDLRRSNNGPLGIRNPQVGCNDSVSIFGESLSSNVSSSKRQNPTPCKPEMSTSGVLQERNDSRSYASFSSFPTEYDGRMMSTGKPYARVLQYISTPCDNYIQWLISIGHSVTVVSHPDQMAGFLRCGIESYDIVVIEWSSDIITTEVQEVLHEARQQCKSVPVFFCILGQHVEDTAPHCHLPVVDPPLPTDVQPHFIIAGSTMRDACMRNRLLMRSQLRLWRIVKDLRGDDSLRYQIRRRIGSGSFGDVYEVSLYASKGRLAMKRIRLGDITLEHMENLYREAVIMRALDHRNIVQLSHIMCDDTYLNIFMELCDCTLKEAITEGNLFNDKADTKTSIARPPGPSPVSPSAPFQLDFSEVYDRSVKPTLPPMTSMSSCVFLRATSNIIAQMGENPTTASTENMFMIRDVLSAVHYLHSQDIVHRDLKPQNILFLNGVAKLADFGTATTVNDSRKSLNKMKGTMPYMAPEVFLGDPYRKPCDIWSLGILIGEILGLHFAHTTLLHMPSLHAYYKSLDEGESMPVVLSAHGSPPNHMSDELLASVQVQLVAARKVAKEERRRLSGSSSLELNASVQRQAYYLDGNPIGALSKGAPTRTVFVIDADNGTDVCDVTPFMLPATLVELLESTFYRNPERRVTAEELLEHPIANEKDWMTAMIAEVTQLNSRLALLTREGGSHKMVDLSFSASGAPSSDDGLERVHTS